MQNVSMCGRVMKYESYGFLVLGYGYAMLGCLMSGEVRK